MTTDPGGENSWYRDPPADPLPLLADWLRAAGERGVREPGALALATTSALARSSSRIVQVLEVTGRGLVFASFTDSQKGREIAETGWASGVLYWREVRRQVVVAGTVVVLPTATSDGLWDARPDRVLPMSVATRQSAPLTDEAALRARVDDLVRAGGRPARPRTWVGYRLDPVTVEFWQDSPDRFYSRLRYDWAAERWRWTRLQP